MLLLRKVSISIGLASFLLTLTGCGTLTGLPAHGGGKRSLIEQELVITALRGAIDQIDFSPLRGKTVFLDIGMINDIGGGSMSGGKFSLGTLLTLGGMVSPVTTTDHQYQGYTATSSTVNVSTVASVSGTNGSDSGTSATNSGTTTTSTGSGTNNSTTVNGASTNTSTTNSQTNSSTNTNSGTSTSNGSNSTTTTTGGTVTTQVGTNSGTSTTNGTTNIGQVNSNSSGTTNIGASTNSTTGSTTSTNNGTATTVQSSTNSSTNSSNSIGTSNTNGTTNTTTNTLNESPVQSKTQQKGNKNSRQLTLAHKGLGNYQTMNFQVSDNAYMIKLLRFKLRLQGVELTYDPSTADATLAVMVDVFGILRTRTDWAIHNKEKVKAKTTMEVAAFDRFGKMIMSPRQGSYEAIYEESYVAWIGPYVTKKYQQKGKSLQEEVQKITQP